jgi:hypothetical protein
MNTPHQLIGLYTAAFIQESGAALDDADPADELCCVFARSLDRRVYGRAACDRAPKALWMLEPEAKDPWGPVTAVIQAGLAFALYHPIINDPGVYRGQGWRGTPFAPGVSGHTITVIAADAFAPGEYQQVAVLDSAAGRNERWEIVDWARYCAQFRGGLKLAKFLHPSIVGV